MKVLVWCRRKYSVVWRFVSQFACSIILPSRGIAILSGWVACLHGARHVFVCACVCVTIPFSRSLSRSLDAGLLFLSFHKVCVVLDRCRLLMGGGQNPNGFRTYCIWRKEVLLHGVVGRWKLIGAYFEGFLHACTNRALIQGRIRRSYIDNRRNLPLGIP